MTMIAVAPPEVPTAPESGTQVRRLDVYWNGLAPHESPTAPPRSECAEGPRPCERRCRYRLASREASCALDVIEERGELTLEEIASYFGLTAEAVRQAEHRALRKIRRARARRAALEGAPERQSQTRKADGPARRSAPIQSIQTNIGIKR